MQVVGVDVGGTNIEVGLVGDDHEVTERGKTDTPDGGPEAVLDAIAALLEDLDGEPSAIGLGIPGVVHEGRALTVPNLPNWGEPVDLVSALTDRTGLPVVLGNDANVGLLGEWLAGAAKPGRDDVLGVWLGTGVGGGLVLDGRPYLGARGAAGEVGHVVVRQGGQLCSCGRRGCVEAYAGRRSMEAAVAAQVAAGRPSSLDSVRRDKGKAAATSGVWEDVLADGDEVANEVFATGIEALGAGIGSVLNVLDVDLVVVGGGLVEKLGSDLTDRIGAATRPWVLRASPDLRFAAAGLGRRLRRGGRRRPGALGGDRRLIGGRASPSASDPGCRDGVRSEVGPRDRSQRSLHGRNLPAVARAAPDDEVDPPARQRPGRPDKRRTWPRRTASSRSRVRSSRPCPTRCSAWS